MPISYRLDAATGIAHTRIDGAITDDDLLAHVAAIDSDPAVAAAIGELVDITAADPSRLSAGLLRDVASNAPRTSSVRRIAVVAGNDLGYGLARMFELVADVPGFDVAVVREHDQALAWLLQGRAAGDG